MEAGDVVIILQEKPHEKFTRTGDDLMLNHTITLTEALCGFNMNLKHLDGRDIIIKHPPGQVVKPGTVFPFLPSGIFILKSVKKIDLFY